MSTVFPVDYIMLSDTQSFAATLVHLMHKSREELNCKICNGSISDMYVMNSIFCIVIELLCCVYL